MLHVSKGQLIQCLQPACGLLHFLQMASLQKITQSISLTFQAKKICSIIAQRVVGMVLCPFICGLSPS